MTLRRLFRRPCVWVSGEGAESRPEAHRTIGWATDTASIQAWMHTGQSRDCFPALVVMPGMLSAGSSLIFFLCLSLLNSSLFLSLPRSTFACEGQIIGICRHSS